jgi:ABC-type nitrate/sulfonate/bicarbonate transport system permease component
MTKRRVNKTATFLVIVTLLSLLDLAYFAGIKSIQYYHPFRIFRLYGSPEEILGFLRMMRQVILFFVPGFFIGIGAGSLILRSAAFTQTALRFLRLGLWLPFLFLPASSSNTFMLTLPAALLCSMYHYLAAHSLLGFNRNNTLRYVAGETFLLVFFFSLISQLWVSLWPWFIFSAYIDFTRGFEVFALFLVFLLFTNWVFRSNFDLAARRHEIILTKQLNSADRKSFIGALLLTILCFVGWQILSPPLAPFFQASPFYALRGGYYLIESGEIWGDIGLSLLEVIVGLLCGALLASLACLLMFPWIRKVTFYLLPLTYLSPIVLYLIIFIYVPYIAGRLPGWIYFWHKVVAIGLLTFFPFIETLWGLRDQQIAYRVLLAIDDALPMAFIIMLFGEAFTATQGIGFMMTVANATYQTDKAVAGFFLCVLFLVTFSTIIRTAAKALSAGARESDGVPAPAV